MCEVRACRLRDSAGVSAPAAAAPTGVVTFLFTDVEGSTRRWEADADGMRVALAAHDAVLRNAIEAHGGWLFKHTRDARAAASGVRRGRPAMLTGFFAACWWADVSVRFGVI
jgi:class 3 adenylate cyclase